ncbi:hypothetical protein ACT3SZ_15220, partial [Corynebacterium sp. AOP40-9SA-29]|uniref:hypothetical protein n=1 Tax=Corynebacterium sp. AOP40-9SA-29 TaxID=3457677 RepID=UPI0040342231
MQRCGEHILALRRKNLPAVENAVLTVLLPVADADAFAYAAVIRDVDIGGLHVLEGVALHRGQVHTAAGRGRDHQVIELFEGAALLRSLATDLSGVDVLGDILLCDQRLRVNSWSGLLGRRDSVLR